MQQVLQHHLVELAQFLAQPVATGKGALDIKAVRSTWVKLQLEAQFDDEQGMLDEKVSELAAVDQAFLDAHQKGFEVGAFGVRRPPTRRALRLPLLDEGAIEQGEQRAIVSDHGIMSEQLRHGRLVKDAR